MIEKELKKLEQDKDLAKEIFEVLGFHRVESEILDETTLILLKSDDSVKRLKGIREFFNVVMTNVQSKLSEENVEYIDVLSKRQIRLTKELTDLIKLVKHLKEEHYI